MARKKNTDSTLSETVSSTDASTADVQLAPVFEPVKVNNANVTELKIACDDAVRRYFSKPELFKAQHTHTDVHLALGWASVFVALITAGYSYKYGFEPSKPVVWVGVILYVILTSIQTAYSYFVQGQTIFLGKRKTVANRIETEHLSIATSTSSPKKTPRAPNSTGSQPASIAPQYTLTLSFLRSSNGGKTLVKRKQLSGQRKPYSAFFDAEGTLNEAALVQWLSELGASVMEEGPGVTIS